jgi:hypothetical protein
METAPPAKSSPRRWWPYAVALLALLAVYTAYLQPDFMVALANEVWACF